MQFEIVDETDQFVDNEQKVAVNSLQLELDLPDHLRSVLHVAEAAKQVTLERTNTSLRPGAAAAGALQLSSTQASMMLPAAKKVSFLTTALNSIQGLGGGGISMSGGSIAAAALPQSRSREDLLQMAEARGLLGSDLARSLGALGSRSEVGSPVQGSAMLGGGAAGGQRVGPTLRKARVEGMWGPLIIPGSASGAIDIHPVHLDPAAAAAAAFLVQAQVRQALGGVLQLRP